MKKLFLITLAALSLSASIAFADTVKQIVELSVTEKGFEPNSINVKPQVPVTLKITRKTDSTCATQVQIPAKKIKKDLPLNQVVTIEVGKLDKGEVRFACGMSIARVGFQRDLFGRLVGPPGTAIVGLHRDLCDVNVG